MPRKTKDVVRLPWDTFLAVCRDEVLLVNRAMFLEARAFDEALRGPGAKVLVERRDLDPDKVKSLGINLPA